MKIQSLSSQALLAFSTLAASVSAEAAPANRFFVDPRFPSEVQAAHELFYQEKFDAMAVEIKTALLKYPRDAAIRQDVLALFDAAYELRGNGAVNPDYRLPDSVTWMSVADKKRMRSSTGAIAHRFTMSLDHKAGSEIDQLRVVRYPDAVILDKQAGIGEFEPADEPDGTKNLWAAGPNQREALPEGLYLFDLKMKGQETMHGWFLFSRMTATESPTVTVPAVDQVLATATPTFAWKNFVSSEFRNYERRKVFVAVGYADGREPDLFQFSSKTGGSQPTETTVDKPLPSDEYVMRVSYRERREFGPLTLSRESDTAVPFTVKAAK
ncbi:MAG: hypothetical protein JST04_01690 [Bdellovibrionales bacterium]|nr:hypothetical protein [Bdellovibrionales bacterium]